MINRRFLKTLICIIVLLIGWAGVSSGQDGFWIKQLGTSSADEAFGVATDSAGNVYITGRTEGSLSGTNAGSDDAFIAKYDTTGTLQWTKQLGTSSVDVAYGVAADSTGNVYITGRTDGSLDGTNVGYVDAFIAKYDTTGSLLWKKQLGTSSDDVAYGVAADSAGNVYITGETSGSLGGTNAGEYDAFIAKYDTTGSLKWIKQLGTSSGDLANCVATDSAGNVYITGFTFGSLGGANAGYNDAFIAKFNTTGSRLWTKQLGTSSDDYAAGVATDSAGNVYITGNTQGSLGGTNAGFYDAFVAKYDTTGSLLWTKQLGTSDTDWARDVATDSAGNVYITGGTYGSLDGTNAGNEDVLVAKYDTTGNLKWIKQLGTSMEDNAHCVVTDSAGNVYITGYTDGSLGGTNAGLYDAFVMKLIDSLNLYASFPGAGIWKWDGSAWSQTTPNSPEQMVTSGTTLYGSFTGGGIWKWDGTTWTQVTPNNPQAMVTLGTDLYGTFTGAGIWKWDETTWTQVTPNNPQSMVMLGSDLYGAFTGQGIWKWNGSTWTQATPNTPDIMVATGIILYGSFAGGGIWKWDGATWTQATPNNPQLLVAQGENLFGSFTGQGIWKWDGITWTQATPNNPQQMVSSATELYGAFTGGGIWKWNGSTWTQVTPNTPTIMVVGN